MDQKTVLRDILLGTGGLEGKRGLKGNFFKHKPRKSGPLSLLWYRVEDVSKRKDVTYLEVCFEKHEGVERNQKLPLAQCFEDRLGLPMFGLYGSTIVDLVEV